MKFRWIHLGLALALSVGTTALVGCTADTDPVSEEGLGTLHLPLVTPMQGTFRLGTATFVVNTQGGTPVVTLDSDSDPTAPTLTAPLAPGAYSVKLQDGWTLNSVASDGTESPVRAALITQNPQAFTIKATKATDLSFTFTTDDGIVTIGNGSANISVGVAPNTGLSSCNLTGYYSNCPSGQTCLLAEASGRTFCASPGTLPVGALCSSEQCVAGSQCLNTDANNPSQGVCSQFCDVSSPPFGCNCVSLSIDNSNAGICGAAPAGACDLLDQTSCSNGQACQYVSGSFGTCGDPGTTPPGSSCSSETCTAGYACHGGSCKAICDTRLGYYNNPACPSGGYYYSYCYDVGTGFAGRCFSY